jgi:ATP-dependent RNA helicase DDX18/HAS1
VPLNEYEFKKVANVQSQLENLVEKNYYLHTSAREAYRSYLLAYASHKLKDVFNVHTLNLLSVAKSFGFMQPPRVGFLPAASLNACMAATVDWQHALA